MALSVTLYTFSKRLNSTKNPPSAGGLTIQAVLKDNTSIIRPELEVVENVTTYNYAYIPAFSRYYFVQDVIWEKGIWRVVLSEDVLATYKTVIGDTTAYILRCATFQDPTIIDSLYPTVVGVENASNVGSWDWVNPDLDKGTYVVGLVNNNDTVAGGVAYYALTGAEMAAFRAYMLGSIQSWDQITDFAGDVAKAFIDPFQYVVSCLWFPVPVPAEEGATPLGFGFWSTPTLTGHKLISTTSSQTLTLKRPKRPHNEDLVYLRYPPFAEYYAVADPWGVIPLDGNKIVDDVLFTATFDFVTGKGILRIESRVGEDTQNYRLLYEGQAQVGVTIQLSNVAFNYEKQYSGLSGALSTAWNGLVSGLAGAFSGSGIASSMEASNSILNTTGTNSGMAAIGLGHFVALKANYFSQVAYDKADNGSPLCQHRKISDCTGYVKVENGAINFSATEPEKKMVKEFLEGGFYYE
jgi:hypothetical protein|nr:MAG TPA: hypothetical protein [Caudoviricetes sp.]